MAINRKRATGRLNQGRVPEVRLGLRLSEETQQGLAAWARADGRSTEAQGRFLIEQAVMARGDRLALTRR